MVDICNYIKLFFSNLHNCAPLVTDVHLHIEIKRMPEAIALPYSHPSALFSHSYRHGTLLVSNAIKSPLAINYEVEFKRGVAFQNQLRIINWAPQLI